MESFAVSFAPAFLRIAGLLFFAPLLGSRAFPARLKLMAAAVLALVAVGSIPAAAIRQITDWQLALLLFGEFAFGAVMGLVVSAVFLAAQMAGQIAAQQMGLNFAGSIDPTGATDTGPLAQLYYILTAFVFLLMDGHHLAILGLRASFDQFPPMSLLVGGTPAQAIVAMLASATVLSLCIAAPVCIALLVVDLALGMISKTIPQVSFLSVGMTLRVSAGLAVMILGVGVAATVLGRALSEAMRLAQGLGVAP